MKIKSKMKIKNAALAGTCEFWGRTE